MLSTVTTVRQKKFRTISCVASHPIQGACNLEPRTEFWTHTLQSASDSRLFLLQRQRHHVDNTPVYDCLWFAAFKPITDPQAHESHYSQASPISIYSTGASRGILPSEPSILPASMATDLEGWTVLSRSSSHSSDGVLIDNPSDKNYEEFVEVSPDAAAVPTTLAFDSLASPIPIPLSVDRIARDIAHVGSSLSTIGNQNTKSSASSSATVMTVQDMLDHSAPKILAGKDNTSATEKPSDCLPTAPKPNSNPVAKQESESSARSIHGRTEDINEQREKIGQANFQGNVQLRSEALYHSRSARLQAGLRRAEANPEFRLPSAQRPAQRSQGSDLRLCRQCGVRGCPTDHRWWS